MITIENNNYYYLQNNTYETSFRMSFRANFTGYVSQEP